MNIDGIYSHYMVKITKPLKEHENLRRRNEVVGNEDEILVSVIGGYDPLTDVNLSIAGAPSFQIGERVLLFLQHGEFNKRDASRAPIIRNEVIEISLGAFHEVGYFAIRSEESSMNRYEGNEANFHKVRDFDSFTHYIQRLLSGVEKKSETTDYWVEYDSTELENSIQQRFNSRSNEPISTEAKTDEASPNSSKEEKDSVQNNLTSSVTTGAVAKSKSGGFIPGLSLNNSIIVVCASFSIFSILIFFLISMFTIWRRRKQGVYKTVLHNPNLFKDPEMASGYNVPIAGPVKPKVVEMSAIALKNPPPPPPKQSIADSPLPSRQGTLRPTADSPMPSRPVPMTPLSRQATMRDSPLPSPRRPTHPVTTPLPPPRNGFSPLASPLASPRRPSNPNTPVTPQRDPRTPTLRKDFPPLTRGNINQ